MKYFTALMSLIVLGVYTPALADTHSALTVEKAYAFATSSVQKNGAAFVTFSNTSEQDIAVTAAETPVSERVELHDHIMDGDMMMMREIPQFDVPAQGSLELKPMGKHIMLMGLSQQLIEGESFPITVSFGEEILSFDIEVVKPGMMQ